MNISLVQIGNHLCLANLSWKEIRAEKRNILSGFHIRKELKQFGSTHYAVGKSKITPLSVNDSAKWKDSSYCGFDHPITDNQKIGAHVAALNVPGFLSSLFSSGQDISESGVYVYIIECTLQEDGKSVFWCCAVSSKGDILDDVVTSDVNLIYGHVNTHSSDSTHVILSTHNASLRRLLEENPRYIRRSDDEYPLRLSNIAPEEFITYLNSQDTKNQIRRTSNDLGKNSQRAIRAVAISAVVFSAYCSSLYYEQLPAISFFENLPSDADKPKLKLTKPQKKLKSGNIKWDDASYKAYSTNQFLATMGDFDEDTKSVLRYMFYISSKVPDYLMEYTLKSVDYKEGRYVSLVYVRQPKSNTTYLFLDKAVEFMNDELDTDFKPFIAGVKKNSVANSGDTREYRFYTRNKNTNHKSLNVIAQREELQQKTIVLSSQIEREYNRLKDIRGEYEDLELSEIIFDGKPLLLKGEFDELELSARNLESELKSEQSALKELQVPALDDSMLIPEISDFITMMEIDDQFTWTEPLFQGTVPDKKAIEENLQDTRKKAVKSKSGPSSDKRKSTRKKKDPEQSMPHKIYGPAIDIHSVMITSNKEKDVESGQKNVSLSQMDLLLLAELLDKPFVKVKSVNYDRIKDDWSVEIIVPSKRDGFQLLNKQATIQ